MVSRTAKRKRKTEGRVMHEFKHGGLKSGKTGKGGKVKSRKQAIAIALSGAGESNRKSSSENKRNFRRTRKKERRGETAQQEREHRFGASKKKPKTKGAEHRRRSAGARKAARTRARSK
ncbi:MAG: hypothetical protein JOZ55_00735 [Alphaproteobacteria bacterium]|nr:hypothetical protein [Alphaproteobacteria bacterium]